MKSFTKVAAMAAMATYTDASITACNNSDDWSISLLAFFQGMQVISTDTSTDCYTTVTAMIEKINETNSAFYGPNYKVDDWLAPVYATIDVSNKFVDGFVNCDTTNFAKQFSNRLTTWSGALDLGSTLILAFVKHYADPTNDSRLFKAGNDFFTSTSCVRTARALGEMFHYTVYFEIEDANYVEQLPTDITGQ